MIVFFEGIVMCFIYSIVHAGSIYGIWSKWGYRFYRRIYSDDYHIGYYGVV